MDRLVLLVRPRAPPGPPYGLVQATFLLNQFNEVNWLDNEHRYQSNFHELHVPGATTVLSTSPTTVLGFWRWAELHVTGSHLDLQPLYCKLEERLYELELVS